MRKMFGLLTVRGRLKARSPIFHGGNEKTGSVVLLNRLKFITSSGLEDIPIISGNAIRGVLRRYIFQDFLSEIGYEIDVTTPQGLKLYHALFTGGVLETVDVRDSGIIDVDLKRRVIECIPPLRLFGFSFRNQTIESKLKVGAALPICKELKDYLPDDEHPSRSVYELLTTAYQTRKDDIKAERDEKEQAVQMLIEYELFAPGTEFYHELKLEDPDEVDISCLARCIELWKAKPFIGGKSSIGLGELEIAYDLDASSDTYMKFLAEHKDEIILLLQEMEER